MKKQIVLLFAAIALVAVHGADRYFNTVKGKIRIENNGVNSWQNDPNGKHEYLMWKIAPEELTTVIEDSMMHEPVKKTKKLAIKNDINI